MNRESRQLLTINALYALIPVLLMIVPRLFAKAELAPYGAGYAAYMSLVEFGVIVLPALLWCCTPAGRPAARALWVRRPGPELLLVAPLACCSYFAINGVTVLWTLLLGALGLGQVQQTIAPPQTGGQLAVGLLVIALIPALCEEAFFRGVLQPALHRRLPPWAAVVLGGCLFGLVHGQLAALPGHVLLGIGLCLVAYWTRSVWVTMLWHLIQNGIALVISYFYGAILQASQGMTGMDASAMLTQQPLMMAISALMLLFSFGAGTALFLALLWATTRAHRERPVTRAQESVHPLAWSPLLLAAVCIAIQYARSGISMWGGAA